MLVLMFVNFNVKFANIVRSQNDILEAIKRQTVDNKLTSEEKTSTIICMLQVPISERTTNVLNSCRKQAQEGGNGILPKNQESQQTISEMPSSSSNNSHQTTKSQTNLTVLQSVSNIVDHATQAVDNVLSNIRGRIHL